MGFRIQKEGLEEALDSDISKLGVQSTLAEQQVLAMESTDLSSYGLTGTAYDTLSTLINARSSIVKAHYIIYQRLSAADESNKGALSQVEEFEDDDSVDTDKCDKRIETANQEKESISQQWQDALKYCWDAGSVQGTNTYYLGLMDAQNKIVEANQRVKDKALKYELSVETIYAEVLGLSENMLASATSAVRTWISEGSYGDMSWAVGISTDYEVAKLRNELIVDGEVDKDKVRELFDKDSVTDVELKALGMAYADLMARSQAGDEGPLNTFLSLGYRESGESWSGPGYANTYTVTYESRPGFALSTASWADDSALPEYISSNIRNACDAAGAQFAITSSYTRSAVVANRGAKPTIPLESTIGVSFATHVHVGTHGETDAFGVETISFGDRLNGITAHATYDSDAADNAINMSTYVADENIKDPAAEGLAAAGKSLFSSLTGVSLDAKSLIDSGLDKVVGEGLKAAGKSTVPVQVVKAGVDGVFKYYEITEDNREFMTIGDVNSVAKADENSFRISGGVLLTDDDVVVQAGAPSSKEAQMQDAAKGGYEKYRDDGGAKGYSDWLDERVPGSPGNETNRDVVDDVAEGRREW